MTTHDQRFQDWKDAALAVPLLQAAQQFGAQLKRHGAEWVGPCPYCGGRDRFSVNTVKNKWNCRGTEGGSSAIGMVMHIAQLSFVEATEALSCQPKPAGVHSAPLSASEIAEREKRRTENQRIQQAREAEHDRYEGNTRETASAIWNASKPVRETSSENYLNRRGIPLEYFLDLDCIRHHPGLAYPGMKARCPALVCRVDDVEGHITAIWRIYHTADGIKLPVDNPKLGLGPAGGGAVRIGGIGKRIGLAEGVETALAVRALTHGQYPIWSTLSTSGLIGVEIPLGVERISVWPDGDKPMRRQGEEYVPSVPAGRKAAQTLYERLKGEGIQTVIAAEPSSGLDYLDVFNAHMREVA